MTTTLYTLLTSISTWIGQHPYVTAVLFFFGLGLVLLWSPAQRGTTPRPAAKLSPLDPSELDRALVARYETRFDGLQAQVHQQQRQFEASQAEQRKLTADLQQRLDHGMAELRQLLTTRPTTTTQAEPLASTPAPTFRHIGPQQQQRSTAAVPRTTSTLEIPRDTEPEAETRPAVQLPAGSFVASTLLTGAYAPADQERPLPVLLRINEGFTGPNHTRVPLQACFVVGKAAAGLGAERATIQTARLSCTLPSGQVFEQEVSGYVAARDGLFGVPGKVIRHDAAKLGMASVTGFLSGAAQALSRAESTTVFSPASGATFSAVTGDTTRYTAYAGLSETAHQLSRYYLRLANQITPAIQIPANLDVHLVMNEGVTINGLYVDDLPPEPVRYAGAPR